MKARFFGSGPFSWRQAWKKVEAGPEKSGGRSEKSGGRSGKKWRQVRKRWRQVRKKVEAGPIIYGEKFAPEMPAFVGFCHPSN